MNLLPQHRLPGGQVPMSNEVRALVSDNSSPFLEDFVLTALSRGVRNTRVLRHDTNRPSLV